MPKDHHFDPDSDPNEPRWYMVDLKYRRRLKRTITLPEMKAITRLDGFQLLKRGNRLSVMPVSKRHWDIVLGLENKA